MLLAGEAETTALTHQTVNFGNHTVSFLPALNPRTDFYNFARKFVPKDDGLVKSQQLTFVLKL
jgi:hypothetical protein